MAIELVRLVAGLPVGPATEEVVRKFASVPDDRNDVELQASINAANAFVVGLPKAVEFTETASPTADWPHDLQYGASLLATRLFKRRNSAEGVAAFSAGPDGGAVYVQRNDPDIAMMLAIGAYTKPAVG